MFGLGLFKGLVTTFRTLLRPPVTIQYPVERRELSSRTHGAPGLIWDPVANEPKCTGCGLCMRECPVGVIHLTSMNNPRFKAGSNRKRIVETFSIDLYRCIYCAICVDVCPFEAIEMTKTYELARFNKLQIVANIDELIDFTETRPMSSQRPPETPTADDPSGADTRTVKQPAEAAAR